MNKSITRNKFFLFFFSFCFFNLPVLFAQRQHLLFENSFESSAAGDAYLTGTIGGAMHNDQHCCTYSIQKATSSGSFTAREGTGAVRYELRSTDPPVSQSLRAELTMPDGYTDAGVRWYGFSYYFENWQSDSWVSHELQWHPDNNTGAAELQLRTTNNQYTIVHGTEATSYHYDVFPAPYRTVVSNVWVDFVFHVKFAADNTGFLQVWKDGVLLVDESNIVTAEPEGQYIKIGINNWSWYEGDVGSVTQRVFYIDEVRVGDQNASYCDVAPTCSSLPVTLVNLSASPGERKVTLRWSTSSESNNRGFDVQRSIDDVNWTTIAFVAGVGNSSTITNYSYVDDNLESRKYYYRLNQTDIDAHSKYSVIVSAVIRNNRDYTLGQNYPNPFANETTIQFTIAKAGQVNISLFDINGRTVRVLVNGSREAGTHAISFYTGNLVKGVYYYRIQAGDFTDVKKLTIQ